MVLCVCVDQLFLILCVCVWFRQYRINRSLFAFVSIALTVHCRYRINRSLFAIVSIALTVHFLLLNSQAGASAVYESQLADATAQLQSQPKASSSKANKDAVKMGAGLLSAAAVGSLVMLLVAAKSKSPPS